MTSGAVALLLLALQGGALGALLAGRGRIDWRLVAAAALPLGLAVHHAVHLPLALIALAPSWVSVGSVTAGLVLAAWMARGRPLAADAPPAHRSPEAWTPVDVALAGLTGLLVVLAATVAALEPIAEWDTVAIWAFKARLAATGALVGGRVLADPALAYAHLDYPLLWPLALAADPAFGGTNAIVAGRLLAPALLASGCALLFVLLEPTVGRRAALAAAVLLASLPIATAEAIRGQADLPLAVVLLAAAGALARGRLEEDRLATRIGAVALVALPLVKSEGAALAAAVAIFELARRRPPARRALLGSLAAAAILLLGPWAALRSTLPALHHHAQLGEIVAGWGHVLERLAPLALAIPRYLLAPSDWGLFWPLVVLALAAAALLGREGRRPLARAAAPALALPFYALVLLTHALAIEELAEVTLSRLALGFAGVAALAAGDALGVVIHAVRRSR